MLSNLLTTKKSSYFVCTWSWGNEQFRIVLQNLHKKHKNNPLFKRGVPASLLADLKSNLRSIGTISDHEIISNLQSKHSIIRNEPKITTNLTDIKSTMYINLLSEDYYEAIDAALFLPGSSFPSDSNKKIVIPFCKKTLTVIHPTP